MRSHEGLQSEAQGATALPTDTQPPMAVDRYGFHGTAHVQISQLPASHDRPSYVAGTPDTYNYTCDLQGGRMALPH